MNISYDTKADSLSIVLRETTVTTEHRADGIAADCDADGNLAGIEILDASKRLENRLTLQQVVTEGVVPVVAAA